MKDLSIGPKKGTLLSIPLSIAMVAAVVIPHWLMWRENAILVVLENAAQVAFSPTGVVAMIGAFAIIPRGLVAKF